VSSQFDTAIQSVKETQNLATEAEAQLISQKAAIIARIPTCISDNSALNGLLDETKQIISSNSKIGQNSQQPNVTTNETQASAQSDKTQLPTHRVPYTEASRNTKKKMLTEATSAVVQIFNEPQAVATFIAANPNSTIDAMDQDSEFRELIKDELREEIVEEVAFSEEEVCRIRDTTKISWKKLRVFNRGEHSGLFPSEQVCCIVENRNMMK